MTTGPYGTAATTYWTAGWRGILPLPPKAKANPPRGYTGDGGLYPSFPDIHTWTEGPERLGNIALRMPANVIGIDVDAYGDKPGKETLRLAEATHGPLPPTWRTTSRDDGTSGIRLYRVPEGLAWPGEIGPATELIQARHRYAVVWPSVHPEGRTYRWISPDGIVSTTIPDPDTLPQLPQAWVEAYTGGELATATTRTAVGHADALMWVAGQPHATDTMCRRMERAVEQFTRDLPGSAHNAARDATLRVARLAHEGHHGAVHALGTIRQRFLADATDPHRTLLGKNRRTESEAVYEFGELVASGVGVVIANPTGVPTCDCYGQLTGTLLGGNGQAQPGTTDGSAALAPLTLTETAATDDTTPDPAPDGLKRMRDGAAFILDAPDTVPAIWGHDDEVMWAEGEALMVVGPPGVGKTTLTGQLVRGLLGLQAAVLGLPVRPAQRRVLYLAMDRPAQIARGLRRVFTEDERDILADRLRVWEGPPPGDVARHPDVLLSLANLADADVVIIDSVKDAAVGLTEDEVAAAYNRARQTCLANGVQVLELHHMVKRGGGGGKPTELADVYGSAWLTAGAGSVLLLWGAAGDPIVEMRHLKQPAAEVGPWRLRHDHPAGTTEIFHGVDILSLAASTGTAGVTAVDVARQLFEVDHPSENDKQKARDRLNALVDQGSLERFDEAREGHTGGRLQARFRVPISQPEPNQEPFSGEPTRTQPGEPDAADSERKSQPGSQPGQPGPIPTRRVPSSKEEGGRTQPMVAAADQVEEAPFPTVPCGSCRRMAPKVVVDTYDGNCADCADEIRRLT